jgi:hypothetical protein
LGRLGDGAEELFESGSRDEDSAAEDKGGDLAPPHALVRGGAADAEDLGDLGNGVRDRACRRTEQALGRDVKPTVVSAPEWREGRSGFIAEVRRGPVVPIVEVKT